MFVQRQLTRNPDTTRRIPPTLVLKSVVDATVSVDAVIDNFLTHLQPERHELVLFDINRRADVVSLMLRLRHNPFYAYLETRTMDWIAMAEGALPER